MKRNLLIVDDEELIRKGLIARLGYLGFEFEEITEAENGTRALEIVMQRNISAVITDIRMPDMDGLDFIKEAKKINPRLRFMVLSGYADFEYAKTAISLGAGAYLLKPLSNEELKEELNKLLKELDRDAMIRRSMTSRQKLEKENNDYTLEKEINVLLHEPKDEHNRRDKYPLFYGGISSDSDNLLLLGIMNIEERSCENYFSEDDTELIRFAVRNVFNELASPCKGLLVNNLIQKKQMYALFAGNSKDKCLLRRDVEQLFLEMRPVLEKKMRIYLTMGVSSPTREFSAETLCEAEAALRQRLVYGEANLYFYEDITVFSGKSFPASELYFLELYMTQSNLNGIRNLLDKLFSERMIQQCGISCIRVLWLRLLNLMLKYYEPEIRENIGIEDLLHNFRLLDEVCLPDRIRRYASEIITDCINNRGMKDVNSKDKICLAAQYINKHYHENLAINDLAKLCSMSPNYFSSIFKKELNQSAVNYITKIRMEKARDYLEHTDLSVIEIAERVGYEDSQYFFRVFKKNVGITPLQYRRQCPMPKT